MDHVRAEAIIATVTAWAVTQPDILAFALVGSWARGRARPDSDIDLMALTADPQAYREDLDWPAQISWPDNQVASSSKDNDYGIVWSRHIRLTSGELVELTFASDQWASTSPVDTGTMAVVQGGLRSLHDPFNLLAGLAVGAP